MIWNVEDSRKTLSYCHSFWNPFDHFFLFYWVLYLFRLKEKDKLLDWEEIVVTLPIFRFIFMVILLILCGSRCLYSQEIPNQLPLSLSSTLTTKITHVQLFRVSYNFFQIFSDHNDDANYIYDLFYRSDIYNKTLIYFNPPTATFAFAILFIMVLLCFFLSMYST
jgi:hypothetical protein